MLLCPFHWKYKGGINIKKIKQFYKDLNSSEKYWSEEGNNKRMQFYHKLSKGLKIVDYIVKALLILYILILCTNSLFSLFHNSIINESIAQLDFNTVVLNTYKITFISILLLISYYGRKNNYTIKKTITSFLNSLLLLPICVLLIYNFMILGSLMSSFYLLVTFIMITFVTKTLSRKIDRL